MATPGFAGKIFLVNLTSKEIKALDTEKYEQFGAGHGMATALFWEFCVEPGDWDLQDAFHPRIWLPSCPAFWAVPVFHGGQGQVFQACLHSAIPYSGSRTAISAVCFPPS